MKTLKLFYKKPFKSSCKAKLVEKNSKGFIFDQTISYPEGGGQIGDKGILVRVKSGEEIKFEDTIKIRGRNLFLDNFPSIKVDNTIIHCVEDCDFENIEIGEEFIIKIDTLNRGLATLNHTGAHLALMILERKFPGIDKKIIGAKINERYGRLDFSIDYKFSKELLKEIEDSCNEFIKKDLKITCYHHPEEKEAFYWECDGYVVPCGGTHCNSTGELKKIKLKRKNIGKTSERMIINIEEDNTDFINLYK